MSQASAHTRAWHTGRQNSSRSHTSGTAPEGRGRGGESLSEAHPLILASESRRSARHRRADTTQCSLAESEWPFSRLITAPTHSQGLRGGVTWGSYSSALVNQKAKSSLPEAMGAVHPDTVVVSVCQFAQSC